MATNPYSSPESVPHLVESTIQSKKLWLVKLALFFYSAPIFGLIVTIISLMRAFSVLSEGNADPVDLANNIRTSLFGLMVGGGVGIVGAILILIAFYNYKIRDRFFFIYTVFLSIPWCIFLFPYGLIIGVPIALIFISNRNQFHMKPIKMQNKT